MRATLADSLVELVDALVPPEPSLRLTSLTVDLPLEVALGTDNQGTPVLLAGPPRWRWSTDFDALPGRLHVHLAAGGGA